MSTDSSYTEKSAIIAFLFLLAFAVRLAFFFYSTDDPNSVQTGWGDDSIFHLSAIHILEGKGYVFDYGKLPSPDAPPTAWHPPLYSMIIAIIYSIFGKYPVAVYLFHILSRSVVCVLVYFIAQELFQNRRISILSGIVSALIPDLIYGVNRFQKENLYLLLMCIFVFIMARFCRKSSFKKSIALGVLGGMLCLTRSEFLLAAILMPGVFLTMRPRRIMAKHAACFGSIVLVFILAWGIRNHLVFDKWIFSATGRGTTFSQSNNNASTGHSLSGLRRGERPGLAIMRVCDDETTADDKAFELGKAWIKQNPSKFLLLLPKKFIGLWGPVPRGLAIEESNKAIYFAILAENLVLLPLFLYGLFITAPHWRRLLPIYILFLQATATALIFYGNLRTRAPVLPFMIVIASYAVVHLWDKYFTKLVPAGDPQNGL